MTETQLQIRDIINSPKPFMVFLKNKMCGYCNNLIPVVEILKSRYGKEVGFYFLDVNREKDFVKLFEDDINGVPTVILFCKEKYIVLEAPAEPDPYLWYTLSYLDDFVMKFLGREDA